MARTPPPAAPARFLRVIVPCVALLALAAVACAGAGTSPDSRAKPKPKARFSHAIVVVFENHEAEQVLGNSQAPTFNMLASRYATLTNYTAVTHPSLPNYLALVSGSTQGIDSNCTSCIVNGRSLADTLQASKKTWKAYAEGLPYVGFTGATSGRYAKKHNPFVYFRSNLSGLRLRRVVPFTQFLPDLRRKRLPTFSLVIPDLCHDMHDCGVATGDAWLGAFMRPLLRGPALRDTVVFVVFDEGKTDVGGGGRVLAIAVGRHVRRHTRVNAAINHYGLLRTIEEGLGLPLLGRSAGARPVTGIWR
jgi:phosphatidylinositol-3-phosphatase